MVDEAIIITGGNGFVGRHLAAELRRSAPATRLVIWDRSVEQLPDGVAGIAADITEPASYQESLRAVQPAWIVHLAAVASAAKAQEDESLAYRINVEGTRQLLESVRRNSPETRVLAVSTADIYGQGSVTPLSELPLSDAMPRNPYAKSKWEMERVIEQHFSDRVIRVRPFPHIGPGQALGYVSADFASQVAAIEAGNQEPVIRVGNLTARRDFTDVRDVVRAYRLLMECGELGEVYHVASGRAVAIQSILDRLLAQARVSINVAEDPARLRPSDTPVAVGDATKLRRRCSWQPTISLDQTLADILTWWREHE